MSERLVDAAGRFLERRTSRRSFLMKAVMAGTAIAAGPVRYLLRPQSAWATVPSQCPGGNCGPDSYTEFCCTVNINPGLGRNTCPSYAYVGGWWKACSGNYTGPYMCSGKTRYFMDCNLIPGDYCVPHCSQNNCNYRGVCINDFLYGNCHAGKYGVTPVVCRLISCIPPVDYTGGCFQCNSTFMEDYHTCDHEAGCRCAECANPNNTDIGSCGDGCC